MEIMEMDKSILNNVFGFIKKLKVSWVYFILRDDFKVKDIFMSLVRQKLKIVGLFLVVYKYFVVDL